MPSTTDQETVREIISTNRYLSLATTDGKEPWVAPIEYLADDDLNFYFLSTGDSRHSGHIERNSTVALTIFDTTQPEYSANLSATLRGVQVRGSARRLSPDEYPESVVQAINALNPPMPPYSAFQVVPSAFYLPKLVDGVNERIEVRMG